MELFKVDLFYILNNSKCRISFLSLENKYKLVYAEHEPILCGVPETKLLTHTTNKEYLKINFLCIGYKKYFRKKKAKKLYPNLQV